MQASVAQETTMIVFSIHYLLFFPFILLVLLVPTFALNTDGVLLLSFKYSILSDPLSVLETWNYEDKTPCLWRGVTCTEVGPPGTPDMFRVTSLVLPNTQLLGSIPPDLGYIGHLKHLDLSNNFLNGSLPNSFFNATELQVISLSGNEISGELPESIGGLESLQLLNLSDNALAGKVPANLTSMQNLTVLSLSTNYFSGYVPGGFKSVEVLDLSSNLLDGSLPANFGGDSLHYLNLSYNKLTGPISQAFAKEIPTNATIDLSFNNLTGAIPESLSLLGQKTESFKGNIDLCGKPLSNLCSIPSTLSNPPNITSSSPAIAVIPKPLDTSTSQPNSSGTNNIPSNNQNQAKSGLKPATIVAIAVSDLAGIGILALVTLYVYQSKKEKTSINQTNPPNKEQKSPFPSETIVVTEETQSRKPTKCPCLTLKGEETSETTTSDDDQENEDNANTVSGESHHQEKNGKLVIVDGETELELETLLKASAYILRASGGSIVYKAVLGDGTAFAVRRIGESAVERLREFENQVRLIAKLKHPNLVKVRGFYWGNDEKLVICDYVSNGSLDNYRKQAGPSPSHVPLEVRFKIARGVARGVAFIHEKKHIHGNIKPSNILLTPDMEPVISDFALDRLVLGNKAGISGRHYGSQRSTYATQDQSITGSLYAPPASSSAAGSLPYQAPESLNNPKPNAKWDVYSFGIVLLELLTGRVVSDRELSSLMMDQEKNRLLRLGDLGIWSEVEAKEEALLACLKLGLSCASFVPQKRPSMKEALQALEKIPPSPSISN